MPTRYVMTRSVLTRQTKRHGKIVCHICGKPIKVGDRVVSHYRGGRKYKVRHERCYESTFIKES